MNVYSCEPFRTRAYAEDLRWRCVWAIMVNGQSVHEAALRAGVCLKTAYNWWSIFQATGDVEKKTRADPPVEPILMDDLLLQYLLVLLDTDPTLYLYEALEKLHDATGARPSVATVCSTLKKLGWSRQIVARRALQRCQACRTDFITEVMMAIPRRCFVWVDECGCECNTCLRRRGWGPAGVTPVVRRHFREGRNTSCIAGVAEDGLVALRTTNGHVDGDGFFHFCLTDLIPEMQVFDCNVF